MNVYECDRKYTLEELKGKARLNGLSPSGDKHDLCRRLIDAGAFQAEAMFHDRGKRMPQLTKSVEEREMEVLRRNIIEKVDRLTRYDLYEIVFKVEGLRFSSGETKVGMTADVARWLRNASINEAKKLLDIMNAKLAEKAQYPVTGEAPGTRYIKWSDFTRLPSYPTIANAVSYVHDYKRKCSPQTKDGYVSVDAIYNMSAWASWKSSSLGASEKQVADEISKLPLLELMRLNKGRRHDQPALFPAGLLK